MSVAYISIGSNIGDKLSNCLKGIGALTEKGKSLLLAQSRFYETEPVDYKDQDWFVNAVIKIETELDPFQLLNELKRIEKDAGRNFKAVRFGPRILDLDILLYDDLVLNSSELEIPHPRMYQRRFVLQPMCDIASNLIHPVLKQDMQYILNSLEKETQKITVS